MTDFHHTIGRTDRAMAREVLNKWESTLAGYRNSGQPYCTEAEWIRDQAYGAYRMLVSLRLYELAFRAHAIYTSTARENIPNE